MLGDGSRAPGKGPWIASSRPERRELGLGSPWATSMRRLHASTRASTTSCAHDSARASTASTKARNSLRTPLVMRRMSSVRTASRRGRLLASSRRSLACRCPTQGPGRSLLRDVLFEDGFLADFPIQSSAVFALPRLPRAWTRAPTALRDASGALRRSLTRPERPPRQCSRQH